jgi:hypothetical protein
MAFPVKGRNSRSYPELVLPWFLCGPPPWNLREPPQSSSLLYRIPPVKDLTGREEGDQSVNDMITRGFPPCVLMSEIPGGVAFGPFPGVIV